MMGGGDKRGYMPMINYTIVYIDDCNDNNLVCVSLITLERCFVREFLNANFWPQCEQAYLMALSL